MKEDGKLTIIDNTGKGTINRVDPGTIGYNATLAEMLKKSKYTYCVSRDSNIDGIGTPALLIRNYGMSPKRIFFMQQKDFKLLLDYVKRIKPKGCAFVIGDLSLNDDQIPYIRETISRLKRDGNKIIWLDHHPWKNIGIDAIKKIDFGVSGENEMYSAAQLAYVLLCNKEKDSRLLSDMIHVSDFALKSRKFDSTIERLSGAIMSFRWEKDTMEMNLQKLAVIVSEMDFNNPLVRNAYLRYRKASDTGIKMLNQDAGAIAVSPYIVAVGFSKKLQTNQACSILNSKYHSDIEIYIDIESGKSGTRSRKGVDCALIASALNGGGHPQASGFVIDPRRYSHFNKEGRKKLIKELLMIIEKSYNVNRSARLGQKA